MDSNSSKRVNLYHITPCNEYGQTLNKSFLTNPRKFSCSFTWINIFLVATQRTGLPASRYLALETLLGVLPDEVNVPCYKDLGWTNLFSQWLGQSLTPFGHLTSTSSSTTIRFGNSHNIPYFLSKFVKNYTKDQSSSTSFSLAHVYYS